MNKYVRGNIEEDREILIKEVIDKDDLKKLKKEKKEKKINKINKTLLSKIIKEVIAAMLKRKSIVGTIKHVRDAKATKGTQLTHDDVRSMIKIITEEYASSN